MSQIDTTPFPMITIEGSAKIAAIGYDEATERLGITFHDSPSKTYIYAEVPADTYHAMLGSESRGKFFIANVLNKFSFARVGADGQVEKEVNFPAAKEPAQEPAAA